MRHADVRRSGSYSWRAVCELCEYSSAPSSRRQARRLADEHDAEHHPQVCRRCGSDLLPIEAKHLGVCFVCWDVREPPPSAAFLDDLYARRDGGASP